MTNQLAKRGLRTRFGTFSEHMFDNDVIALTKGSVKGQEDVLCRVHSSCLSGHAFASVECKCLEEMEMSQRLIEKAGLGVIIWLEHEGRGNGHLAVMKTQELKSKGIGQSEAYETLGYPADARSFEPAAEVLTALGIKSIRLISGSSVKAAQLREYGVEVAGLLKLITGNKTD